MTLATQPHALERMFNPRSLVLVGATLDETKVTSLILQHMIKGGYEGAIYLVHPNADDVRGIRAYPSLEAIGEPIDLVMIAVNTEASLEVIEQCGKLGHRNLICVAGGFRESGEAGARLEGRLVELAGRYDLRILGPNTLGFVNVHAKLNTTFNPADFTPGGVAMVSQSGGIGQCATQLLRDHDVGISKFIGVGNRAVLEFSDVLDYLLDDDETRVISFFVEGMSAARRFIDVARRARGRKPIIVYKAGRSEEMNRATHTHTGALVGRYDIYEAALKQAGVLMVNDVRELVIACQVLDLAPLPSGSRVAVYTHTAGPGIVAMDELLHRNIELPLLSQALMKRMRAPLGERAPVSLINPIDVSSFGTPPDVYAAAMEPLLDSDEFDVLLAIYITLRGWDALPQLLELRVSERKPFVYCAPCEFELLREVRLRAKAGGIAVFQQPEDAAVAVSYLMRFAEIRRRARADSKGAG